MPQAVISWVTGVLVSAGATAATAAFLAKVFVYAATTYLLNRAAAALAPKQRANGLGAGSEVNYYDSGASIRIVYGQVRTGGMETIPPITSGTDNKLLHKVLTLAGHEIDSYNYAHFDTTTIVNAQIGAMAYTSSDGQVSSGTYNGKAWIRRYRGTSTDSADRILTIVSDSSFINARARGIAKAAVTFEYDSEVYRSVPAVTFTYQGKRCYDPRLDTSPGANPTNASYIAWTQNPALCLCDYLMAVYGGEYEAADIDWDTVVTAANYCDGTVSTPSGNQARYTCNGVLFATDDFEDNVKTLVDTMLGRIIFRDGKWRVYAGSWQTPTFTINKEDWISGLSIRFEHGRDRRFNRMRCWFIDPDRDWQRVECNPRFNNTYKTADGEESIDAETEQLLCTREFEAQRKAEFLLRQSRNQVTVTGRLPPKFQNIALWDTGFLIFDHLGWSSKTFRCVGIDMNPDGSMDCVFSEEQDTDWTDLASGDYNGPSIVPLPAINSPFLFTVYRDQVATGAFTFVSNVNCTATQVFSHASAFPSVTELGRVDFDSTSFDNSRVSVTAFYRTGLQNINGHSRVRIRFVTGVSSVYNGPSIPIGGTTTDMQPITQASVFSYTSGNSAYVALSWDVASGANSFTFDNVSIRTEFIMR